MVVVTGHVVDAFNLNELENMKLSLPDIFPRAILNSMKKSTERHVRHQPWCHSAMTLIYIYTVNKTQSRT